MKCDTLMIASWDEPLETALAALSTSSVSLCQLQEAAGIRRKRRPVIGRLGLKHGMLSMSQVFRILEEQALTGGLFGEIAVKAGFLNEVDLYKLLELQSSLAPSLLDVLTREGLVTAEQHEAIAQQVRQRLQVGSKLAEPKLTA